MLSDFLTKEYASELAIQTNPVRLKHVTRNYIPELCAKFGLTKGAEIGVAAGGFSEFMCKTIPGLDLMCVDTWDVGEDRQSHLIGHETAATRYETAKQRLAPFNARLIKARSMDAVRDVPYESLDFVYIDACHDFDFVMQDIIEWAKRVKPGGLISGDDYYRFRTAGVVQAVDTYLYCHKIPAAFITKETEPSFFFTKP